MNNSLTFEDFFGNCSERLKKTFCPSFRSSVVVILQSRNTKDALSRKACSVGGNSTKDLGISQGVPPRGQNGQVVLNGSLFNDSLIADCNIKNARIVS